MTKNTRIKLIESLINIYNNKQDKKQQSLAEFIDHQLRVTQELYLAQEEIIKRKTFIEKQYKADMKNIDDSYKQLIKKCEHPLTTYHPDPSGNNDSTTLCLICGKEI